MTNPTSRLLQCMALLCLAAVAIALVSQHVFDMRPCAWCVLQRLIFIAIAIVCGLGLLAGRIDVRLRRIAALVAVLLSVAGVATALHHYTVAANLFSFDLTFAARFIVTRGLVAAVPLLFGIYAIGS